MEDLSKIQIPLHDLKEPKPPVQSHYATRDKTHSLISKLAKEMAKSDSKVTPKKKKGKKSFPVKNENKHGLSNNEASDQFHEFKKDCFPKSETPKIHNKTQFNEMREKFQKEITEINKVAKIQDDQFKIKSLNNTLSKLSRNKNHFIGFDQTKISRIVDGIIIDVLPLGVDRAGIDNIRKKVLSKKNEFVIEDVPASKVMDNYFKYLFFYKVQARYRKF